MKCRAIIDDYDNLAYYAPAQRVTVPGEKPCSFKARFRVGSLCLCKRHQQLALDGLLDEDGRVAARQTRADVRRYPSKFPHGLYTWARDLEPEEL
ncbi:unnamed protein product [marine sediment metagenome]|uniref:Uncharacterized protein n=1 Tax=marine sediment metagenome TaxID=412755 RepID=X0RJD9_9ZZZZ